MCMLTTVMVQPTLRNAIMDAKKLVAAATTRNVVHVMGGDRVSMQ